MNEVCPTAILVSPSARVKTRRQDIGGFSIRGAADDNDSARFVGTALEPIDVLIGKIQLAETDAR